MDDDLEDDLIALNRAIEHMNRATTTREGDTVFRIRPAKQWNGGPDTWSGG